MAKRDISRAEHARRIEAVERSKQRRFEIQQKQRAERERERVQRDTQRQKERSLRDFERQQADNARAVRQGFLGTASAFSSGGLRIFIIVFGLLTLYNLFGYFTGSNRVFTFSAFLEFLTGAPTIPTDWISLLAIDFGDWGIFQFLADILEKSVAFIQVLIFYGTSIVNALLFILYFVVWIVIG